MEIRIVGRLTTDKVDVLLVDNPLSKNEFPHITLSTAKGVKPFQSNEEIKNNQDKIQPLNDVIKGTVGVFDGKSDITSIKKSKILVEEDVDLEDLDFDDEGRAIPTYTESQKPSAEEEVASVTAIDSEIESLKNEKELLNLKITGGKPGFTYTQKTETKEDGFTSEFNKYQDIQNKKKKAEAREALIEKFGKERVERYEIIDSNFNTIVKEIISSKINIFFDSEEGIELKNCK